MHETPDGIICVSIDDSTHYPDRFIQHDWVDLSVSVVDGGGRLHSQVMRSIGPYIVETLFREMGGFEYAINGNGSGRPLLAMTRWSLVSFCTGSRYSPVAPLRLVSYSDSGFRPILDYPSGRKPVLLRTKSGVAWMAWEAVTANNPDPEFPDRHYHADIRVARISENDRVDMSYSIGPGYCPQLVERTDGTVFVLYRNADHSEARENFSLHLTSLSNPGGGDAILDAGLSISYWWIPNLSLRATADNGLAILMDRVDSAVVYHCDAAANVTRSAAAATIRDQRMELLPDRDGRMVLLWRKTAGEEIV